MTAGSTEVQQGTEKTDRDIGRIERSSTERRGEVEGRGEKMHIRWGAILYTIYTFFVLIAVVLFLDAAGLWAKAILRGVVFNAVFWTGLRALLWADVRSNFT